MAKQMLGVATVNGKINEAQQLSRVAVLTKFYDHSLQAMVRADQAKRYMLERGLDWKVVKAGYISGKLFSTWNETYCQQAEKLGQTRHLNGDGAEVWKRERRTPVEHNARIHVL